MKSILLFSALSAARAEYEAIAGYVPASDVTEHAKIDLDYEAIDEATESGEWDAAWAHYSEGGHSVKGEGFRTLRGFSKDLSGEAMFDEYMAYYGNAAYADDYVRAAQGRKRVRNSQLQRLLSRSFSTRFG